MDRPGGRDLSEDLPRDSLPLELDDNDGSHRVEHRSLQCERRLAVLSRQINRSAVGETIRPGNSIVDSGNLEGRARLAEECEVQPAGLRRDAPFGLRQKQALSANVLRIA